MNVTSDKSGNSSSNDSNGLSNDAQNGNSDNNDDGITNELNDMSIGSSKKKKNTCLCCLKEVEGLLGCSRCLTARYCDKECQVKHWPVHKNSCRDSNDTEDSTEKLQMKARNHLNQGKLIDR
jgi:hypothetical protein